MGEDVLQMFLKDREENGDFISKVSDRLWLKEVLESIDLNSNGGSSAIGLEDNQVNYVNGFMFMRSFLKSWIFLFVVLLKCLKLAGFFHMFISNLAS